MKKRIICALSGLLMICSLAGCSTANATPQQKGTNESEVESSANAYESNVAISAEEQEEEEKERRKNIAQKYSIYDEFGLTYDKNKDRFYYNGKMVRYFNDNVDAENTNSFFYDEGTIDLTAARDTSGKLIKLAVASDQEFAARSAKQKEMEAELNTAGITNETGSYELGNVNTVDDSLDAYSDVGISYDVATDRWLYNNEPIHLFYDPERNTYINNSVENGLDLKVIRDKNGNISKLENMTDAM